MAEGRRRLLLAGAGAALAWTQRAWALAPEILQPSLDRELLRISPPGISFLQGKVLEQLQAGSALVLSVQFTISFDNFQSVQRRSIHRFVYSFDIWEEQFAVLHLGEERANKGTASGSTTMGGNRSNSGRLRSAEAERWPFRMASIDVGQIDRNQPVWLRMELRIDEPKEQEPAMLDPSATLTRLIEWFAKPQRGEPQRWQLQKGPFVLAGLPGRTV